jgi:hypothetical protein
VRERGGQGWAGSVWPTQTRASWFSQPGGLGGPVGLLGQLARWANLVLTNGFKNKILNSKF